MQDVLNAVHAHTYDVSPLPLLLAEWRAVIVSSFVAAGVLRLFVLLTRASSASSSARAGDDD